MYFYSYRGWRREQKDLEQQMMIWKRRLELKGQWMTNYDPPTTTIALFLICFWTVQTSYTLNCKVNINDRSRSNLLQLDLVIFQEHGVLVFHCYRIYAIKYMIWKVGIMNINQSIIIKYIHLYYGVDVGVQLSFKKNCSFCNLYLLWFF